MDTKQLPLTELEGIVRQCESAVLAGTSSHRDVVVLIDAEREIQRRQRTRDLASVTESRASHATRSSSSTGGARSLRF